MKSKQELFEEVMNLDRGERLTQEQEEFFRNGNFSEAIKTGEISLIKFPQEIKLVKREGVLI